MKKMATQLVLLVAGLAGFISSSNGQTTKPKNATTKTVICRHCGSRTCNKNCSLNSATGKTDTIMQNKTLPSCSLTEEEFSKRAGMLSKTIFSKAKSINSIKNGYEIVFTEPKEFSLELIEMINVERTCCSDFTWALIFEPHGKATHLQVYGSKQVKREMENAFKVFGLDHLVK